MRCTRCGKEIEPDEMDWLGECQICWENENSLEYWEWYNQTKGVFCDPSIWEAK